MQVSLHVKHPLLLSGFNQTLFPQSLEYQISGKSIQWEQSFSMWTDKWTGTQTQQSQISLFTILQTHLKTTGKH
jgi:hypothetical protein